MVEYCAVYLIEGTDFSLGGNRDYKYRQEFRFDAGDRETAQMIAKEEEHKLKKEHIGGSVNLESVLRVERIKLED